ncbi:AAA family ATPase [Rhodoferax sp.]|uniref:AAA family ATPase n=1 Tax=Rhodoferax sp. TaxID=50421 RepID=UPI00261B6579|nr:AAA family ATPase [Rhodoferax sp.]MDD2918502.1 AAA family ATPase [Rhodoferax sp.]
MPGLAVKNFRGFDRAIIPFTKTNFFVGENSTGKSSVLALLEILSSPNFYFNQELASEYCDFSAYDDAISARNPNGKLSIGYFRLNYNLTKKGIIDSLAFQFFNDDGIAGIQSLAYISNGYLIQVILKKTLLQYKVYRAKLEDRKAPISTISDLLDNDTSKMQGESVESGTYEYKELPLPSPLITALNILALKGIRSGEKDPLVKTRINPALFVNSTWIAPIRAEAQVINTKNKASYSPKGEHIPTIIRRAFGSKAQAQLTKKLLDVIPIFGEKSHLFETIGVREYGNSPSSPFEIEVRFGGANHRVSNLGYGVSQSLPILLEIASSSNFDSFIIQQPEVHLHPRAQAAFGDFFFEMVKDRDHSLFVETHSDFLIDRYRLRMNGMRRKVASQAQVIFFSQKENNSNHAEPIRIRPDGSYPENLPQKFKDFFLKEELQLLAIR